MNEGCLFLKFLKWTCLKVSKYICTLDLSSCIGSLLNSASVGRTGVCGHMEQPCSRPTGSFSTPCQTKQVSNNNINNLTMLPMFFEFVQQIVGHSTRGRPHCKSTTTRPTWTSTTSPRASPTPWKSSGLSQWWSQRKVLPIVFCSIHDNLLLWNP